MKLLVSPGASSTSSWCEAHGYQPDAIELRGLARVRHGGLVEAVAVAEEGVAVRVEARDGRVDAVDRVVVAPLAVFGLVVDRAVLDLDLADREVALVVRLVVLGVPQAELDEAEQRERLGARLTCSSSVTWWTSALTSTGHEEQDATRAARRARP